MAALTSGAADLALFPLTLTEQRAAAIAHTTPFTGDGYALTVALHQSGGGYSTFLLPFTAATWAALLASLALVSACVITTRIDHNAQRSLLCQHHQRAST